MKCPCCPNIVGNGRYFCSDKCRRFGNKHGVFMPHRYEKKIRELRHEKK